MDDFVEELKLNRRVSFPWQPEVWAGSIEEEEEEGGGGGGGRGGPGERSGERGETPVQLKELLKTEREQKVGRFPHLIFN